MSSVCDYMCRNRPGSYECICPPGQRLLADRKTCAGKKRESPLSFEDPSLHSVPCLFSWPLNSPSWHLHFISVFLHSCFRFCLLIFSSLINIAYPILYTVLYIQLFYTLLDWMYCSALSGLSPHVCWKTVIHKVQILYLTPSKYIFSYSEHFCKLYLNKIIRCI